MRVSAAAVLPLALGALLLFPLVGSGFYIEFVAKVMILAIFALSLELLAGATGLVSLGHAAFYGIAAVRSDSAPTASA